MRESAWSAQLSAWHPSECSSKARAFLVTLLITWVPSTADSGWQLGQGYQEFKKCSLSL